MQDGIYEALFTTSKGALGTTAILIRGRAFVGADELHFYRGEIDQSDDEAQVIMEVTRHDFSTPSAFGSDAMFTLTWRGKPIGDSAFRLSCEPPELGLKIYVSGSLLKAL
ncbi:hypothetical protein [Variovorax sp.]|uniref:hypothetical protein n=1 Tax=Variovorax sp. TaxID=1871043 RepID=UPI002D38A3AA|nr:hypothetical protein [Variovorax sp.]HYP84210.1 hypothetical protein [Variovorax sp.]